MKPYLYILSLLIVLTCGFIIGWQAGHRAGTETKIYLPAKTLPTHAL